MQSMFQDAEDGVKMKAEISRIYSLKELLLQLLHIIFNAVLDILETDDLLNDSLNEDQDAVHDSLTSEGFYFFSFSWDIKLGVTHRPKGYY